MIRRNECDPTTLTDIWFLYSSSSLQVFPPLCQAVLIIHFVLLVRFCLDHEHNILQRESSLMSTSQLATENEVLTCAPDVINGAVSVT